jgi:hypothetical protein
MMKRAFIYSQVAAIIEQAFQRHNKKERQAPREWKVSWLIFSSEYAKDVHRNALENRRDYEEIKELSKVNT